MLWIAQVYCELWQTVLHSILRVAFLHKSAVTLAGCRKSIWETCWCLSHFRPNTWDKCDLVLILGSGRVTNFINQIKSTLTLLAKWINSCLGALCILVNIFDEVNRSVIIHTSGLSGHFSFFVD